MKSKILTSFVASIFLLITLTSFAVATLTLSPISIPTNSSHGTSINVEVSLTSDEEYNSLDWSGSDSNFVLSGLPTEINSGETNNLVLSLNIPKYQVPGTFNANLKVINNTVESNNLIISTIVLRSDKLTISSESIDESTIIRITNTGNTNLNDIILTQSGDSFKVNFSENNFDLDIGEYKEITATIIDESNDLVGGNSITITAISSEGATSEGTLTKDYNFCEYPTLEKLDINKIDFSNNGIVGTTFGDDNTWYLFEEIEVIVEVKNEGQYDMEKIQLEWGLYNTNLNQWVIEVQEEDSDFDLDSKDEVELTFTFKLDTDLDIDFEDLTDGNDYVFYVKATGDISDSDSDNDEKSTCVSNQEEVVIQIEKDFVILDGLDRTYDASCGSELTLDAEVWNLLKDQEDIKLTIRNTQLGISDTITVGDIDEFESQKVLIPINIPENAKEGKYEILLSVLDDKNKIYETDDTDAEFSIFINIGGSCTSVSDTSKALVSAKVESGGNAGEELNLLVTLTNLDTIKRIYTLSATGYSSWASEANLEKTVLSLNSGASAEFSINLNVKEGIEGYQTFYLESVAEDGTIENFPLEVEIVAEQSSFSLKNLFSGDKGITWGIGILNVILIIIIIIVAIKVVKK